jgi:hypothetical protein
LRERLERPEFPESRALLIVPGAGRAGVTMMSRLIPTAVEEINGRLLSLAPEG